MFDFEVTMIYYETELTARTYECDLYGHVNNAAFLNYFEAARVEFLEYLGFTLSSLMKEGFLLPIVRIKIDYKKPVFAGEKLTVSVEWKESGKSSSTFVQKVIKKNTDELASIAEVTWVVTDLNGKPISIPETLKKRVKERFGELPPEIH